MNQPPMAAKNDNDMSKSVAHTMPAQPQRPDLSARIASSAYMGIASALCRGFLYGLNTVDVRGLDRFLAILDQRKDPEKRQRGLITGMYYFSHSFPALNTVCIVLTRHSFKPY